MWTLLKIIYSFFLSCWLVIKMIAMHGLKKSSIQQQDPHIHHWAKRLMAIANVQITIHDTPSNPCSIIMCNHSSLYDIPLSYLAFPKNMRMLGKKELFSLPLWGYAMKCAHHIAVDRKNARSAKHSLDAAKKTLESGVSIWIAPEGTRSSDGHLQAFKSGGFKLAWETRVPIQPLVIEGAHKIVAKHSFKLNANQSVMMTKGPLFKPEDYNTVNELKEAVWQYFNDTLTRDQ